MAVDVDVVVVGGGHNGLVCSAYLAARGLKVRVLERRPVLGGAAVTEEFHPGFRNSTASYTVSLLHPRVIRDLRLKEHGLEIRERPYSNFVPFGPGPGEYLEMGGGLEATCASIARHAPRDAERLPAYYQLLDRVAAVIRELLLETPPNVGGGLTDILAAWRTAKRFKALDMAGRRDVMEFFSLGAAEILERWFDFPAVRACFGFDAIVGHFSTPYAPGSAYVLLHHCFGEVNGKQGVWGHAVGGMGAITTAMAAEARRLGVRLDTEAPVKQVESDGGGARVTLESGEVIRARAVAANVNPRLLFTHLVASGSVPAEVEQRYRDYQCESATFRMNLALDALPVFSCLPAANGRHHQSGIIMAPSLDYQEQAYVDARQLGWSKAPVVEMLIPSTLDDSLAPPGKHVASLFCQHFRYTLPGGQSWDEQREKAADCVVDTLERWAPGIRSHIVARQIHSPLDLERKFGLVNGDIFHGKLTLNQLFSARPVLGYGNYRTPLKNVYLCGSGAHPGGGVTGVPGHNAAREILRDLR